MREAKELVHCSVSASRVRPNVQFYTKCAVLVLICAVLTVHLCSYNLQQCDATPRTLLGELTTLPQTSWLDFGERKERGKGGEKGKGRKAKGKKNGKKRSEREKRGEKEKGTKHRCIKNVQIKIKNVKNVKNVTKIKQTFVNVD